jgi:hypothetical protein
VHRAMIRFVIISAIIFGARRKFLDHKKITRATNHLIKLFYCEGQVASEELRMNARNTLIAIRDDTELPNL